MGKKEKQNSVAENALSPLGRDSIAPKKPQAEEDRNTKKPWRVSKWSW